MSKSTDIKLKELKVSKEIKEQANRIISIQEAIESFCYEIPDAVEEGLAPKEKFVDELDFNCFLRQKVIYPLREKWSSILFGNLKCWMDRGAIGKNIKNLKILGCSDVNVSIRQSLERLGVDVIFYWNFQMNNKPHQACSILYVEREINPLKARNIIKNVKKYNRSTGHVQIYG